MLNGPAIRYNDRVTPKDYHVRSRGKQMPRDLIRLAARVSERVGLIEKLDDELELNSAEDKTESGAK